MGPRGYWEGKRSHSQGKGRVMAGSEGAPQRQVQPGAPAGGPQGSPAVVASSERQFGPAQAAPYLGATAERQRPALQQSVTQTRFASLFLTAELCAAAHTI